jgi:hypothetical protein
MPNYNAPVRFEYETQAGLERRCNGVSATGCAIQHADTCVVVLGPKADQCTIDHEVKTHCKGWSHDSRTVYRRDCGDELPKQ